MLQVIDYMCSVGHDGFAGQAEAKEQARDSTDALIQESRRYRVTQDKNSSMLGFREQSCWFLLVYGRPAKQLCEWRGVGSPNTGGKRAARGTGFTSRTHEGPTGRR